MLAKEMPKVLHWNQSDAVLDFVGRARAAELSARGTTCPDHFLRTKIRPLFVPFDPATGTVEDLLARLPALVEAYRADYVAYYERCKRPDSPAMRDPYPVLVLIPGSAFCRSTRTSSRARVASEYWVNTVNVIRWAEGVDAYAPMSEQDAFDIEYWNLEEAKLRLLPKPKSLAGRIALVTGGAGGIGAATARRLLVEDAHVVITDIDPTALEGARAELQKTFGADKVRAFQCDVNREESVRDSYAFAAREFGGSTSWSATRASPPRPRWTRPRSRSGARTSRSSPPATSWWDATPSRS
jgi:hypothetical protein